MANSTASPKVNNVLVSLTQKFDTALDYLDRAWAEHFEQEMSLVGTDAIEVARAFVKLRHLKDRTEAVAKAISIAYEQIKTTTLPEAFDMAGVPSVNLEEGFRVTVSHKLYASIKKDMKEAALEWLRANDLGDLISPTVNASTLSAVAKTMGEENRELDPELFSVAIVPNTSVTPVKRGAK